MNLRGLTAEALAESRPDLVAEFQKVGFDHGKEEGLTLGREEGAKAETTRLASIDDVAMAGYESIVADAKADGQSTAEDVELAIIRQQRANLSTASTARSTDGTNLAAQTAELNAGGSDAELSDEQQADALMDAAAKNSRGA